MGEKYSPNFIENSLFDDRENSIKLKRILELKQIGDEIFVHYLIKDKGNNSKYIVNINQLCK